MGHNFHIIIVGGGGHAKVVFDALRSMGTTIDFIVDAKYQGDFFGIPRVNEYNPSLNPDAKAVIAIGNNLARQKIAMKCRHEFMKVIDPSALISPMARLGQGVMILHRATVQSSASIGDHVILNTGCQVDHDCVIGNFAHVAPGSVLCGNVSVGEGALIGAGAVITPGIKIGAWSTVGAGAVVVDDVPDNAIVMGIPARSKNKS
jgi:sugar O-acyltransferase (sialic acid O-acetyltransferase NeuD family)